MAAAPMLRTNTTSSSPQIPRSRDWMAQLSPSSNSFSNSRSSVEWTERGLSSPQQRPNCLMKLEQSLADFGFQHCCGLESPRSELELELLGWNGARLPITPLHFSVAA